MSATMSAAEFKQESYAAYLTYVDFIKGKISIHATYKAMLPFMIRCGMDSDRFTVDSIANLLTVRMTAYGKSKGETAKTVKSIGVFRAFCKGGWRDVFNAPVHYNAGKDPSEKTAKKAKKADLAAENAQLRAQLEKLIAAKA